MTLDDFAGITAGRIPTANEFVQFVTGQGWKIATNGQAASLRVRDTADPVALATARMLSREPYRSNVLALIVGGGKASFDLPADDARGDAVTTAEAANGPQFRPRA